MGHCPSVFSSLGRAGRVVKGMGVVQQIESAKVDKRDKPLVDIRIVSLSMQCDE
jgi:hypothetical protein